MQTPLFGQPGTLAPLAALIRDVAYAYLVVAVFVAGVALGRRGAIR